MSWNEPLDTSLVELFAGTPNSGRSSVSDRPWVNFSRFEPIHVSWSGSGLQCVLLSGSGRYGV